MQLLRRNIPAVLLAAFAVVLMANAAVVLACPYCRLGVATIVGTYNQPILPGKKPPATQPAANAAHPATQPASADQVPHATQLPPTVPQTRLPLGLSIVGGADVTTAYYHRGYIMGDQGAITEPYFTLSRPFALAPGITTSPYVGTWMDFQQGGTHTSPAGNGTATAGTAVADMFCCPDFYPSTPKGSKQWITPPDLPMPAGLSPGGNFQAVLRATPAATTTAHAAAAAPSQGFTLYEADITGGVATMAGPFFLDLKYTDYTYPGGALQDYQEVGAKFSVDIIKLLRPDDVAASVILRPYVEVDRETAGVGQQQYTYIETGLEPTASIPIGHTQLGISLPLTFGLSGNGMYENATGGNEALGYYSAGLKLTLPLYQSQRFGDCFLSASVTYLHLNAFNLQILNSGRQDEAIGTIGLGFRF